MTPTQDGIWTPADGQAAIAEGWDIFGCDDINHAPFEIEASHDEGILADDADAWRLVVAKAKAGSALHLRALAFLRANARGEWLMIAAMNFYGTWSCHELPLWVQARLYEIQLADDRWEPAQYAGFEEHYGIPGTPGRWRITHRGHPSTGWTFHVALRPFEGDEYHDLLTFPTRDGAIAYIQAQEPTRP